MSLNVLDVHFNWYGYKQREVPKVEKQWYESVTIWSSLLLLVGLFLDYGLGYTGFFTRLLEILGLSGIPIGFRRALK